MSIMEIPEDLSALKRPALQALCKKHGIKANGKNTDMVKTLEKIRESSKSEENVPTDPLLSELPTAMEEVKVEKKKGGRRGGKKRKRRSGGNKEGGATDSTSSGSDSETTVPMEMDTAQSTTAPTEPAKEDTPPQPSVTQPNAMDTQRPSSPSCAQLVTPPVSTQTSSRKRKRRDTHSVSPNSSLCSAAKLPRLSEPIDSLGGDPCNQSPLVSTSHPLTPQPSLKIDTPLPSTTQLGVGHDSSSKHPEVTRLFSPFFDSASTVESTPSSALQPIASDPEFTTPDSNKENSEEAVLPFSPPTVELNASGSKKRKRHSTFVVSPKEEVTEDQVRERRLTFDVVETSSSDSDETEKKEGSGDVMAELLSMLDKKVEQIQSTPGYKPVHSASSTLASRLPVKSELEKKFDKAHSKHFSSMKSILTVQEERKRKMSTSAPSCAKRPKLSEQSSTKVPVVKPRPSTVKISTQSVVKRDATKNTNTKVFRPTVTSTKNVNTRFSEPAKPKTGSQLKTPKKVSVLNGKNTPGPAKKRNVYNLEESLKKKPAYKPHTGPLPRFKC